MESGFRVLVEVANAGKFWAFVDPKSHNRVEDFNKHLKDIFSMSDPQIAIDGVFLPPKETIRIIKPSDVLSVEDSVPARPSKKNKPPKEAALNISTSEVLCYPSVSDMEMEASEPANDASFNNSVSTNGELTTKKKRKRQRKKNNGSEPNATLESSSTVLNTFVPPNRPNDSNFDKRTHIVFSDDGEPLNISAPTVNVVGPCGDASSHPAKPKIVRVQHLSASLSYPSLNKADDSDRLNYEFNDSGPPVLTPQNACTPRSNESKFIINGKTNRHQFIVLQEEFPFGLDFGD